MKNNPEISRYSSVMTPIRVWKKWSKVDKDIMDTREDYFIQLMD